MLELKYVSKRNNIKKLNIMIIIIFSFLIVSFVTGCKKDTKERSTSSEASVEIEKVGTTSKKVPLSKLVNWEKEKVIDGTDIDKPALVLNDSYVFYATADLRMVRVDRRTKEKIIIDRLKKCDGQYIKESDDYGPVEVGLALSRDKLYYIFDNCLYQCDFDGKKIEKILDSDKIDDNKFLPEINEIHIYKNQIYLQLGLLQVVRFNPDTKRMEFVADDVRSDWCFYKNRFYYRERNYYGFKQVDLKTLKSNYVRGTEWTEKVERSNDSIMYRNLISANGKLYYTSDKKTDEELKLYQYQKNGKDIEKYSIDCSLPTYNSSELVLEQYDEEKNQSTLYLYHFKTGKKKKVSKLYDCSVVGFIEDDIILYKKNENEEKKGKGYTYSSYSMLKVR